MKVAKRVCVSGIIFSMIFVFASSIFAQEANQEAAPSPEAALAPEVAAPAVAVETAAPQSGTLETVAPEAAVTPVTTEPAVVAVTQAPEAAPIPQSGTLGTAAPEAKPAEWVWGEVVSVDTETKQIVIKHLDYDTYEEVQTTLKVGDKTLFENVAALGEIKPGNHLTADFKIVEGSNIADLIVVEKDAQEETAAPIPQSGTLETAAPEAAAPEAVTQAPEAASTPGAVTQAPEAAAPTPVNETAPSI